METNSDLYLNPITLEAHSFLETFRKYGKNYNQVDDNLFATLANIMDEIEKFVNKNPAQIVETETRKLVPNEDLKNIQRRYYCSKCRTDLGKNIEKVTAHLMKGHCPVQVAKKQRNAERRKRNAAAAKNSETMYILPRQCLSLFANDMHKFLEENMAIAEQLKLIPEYHTIEKELIDAIQPIFPDTPIRLYPFGSRIGGIGSRNSDMDIFADIGNTFNTFEDRPSTQTVQNLKKVFEALCQQRGQWSQVISIENARVPIVKACNVHSGIWCDIGFSNSLGYCNTKLVEYLLKIQPVAARMCICLKKWAERAKLETTFTSYSMALMIIFYLQIQGHLPSVQVLQRELDTYVRVGPWIANFIEKSLTDLKLRQLEQDTATVKSLLEGFFCYYAHFDFQNMVVCPYYGKSMAITSFVSELPQRYKDYMKNVEKATPLYLTKSMVVQDPIQLNHNVTKNVSPTQKSMIIQYCAETAAILASINTR